MKVFRYFTLILTFLTPAISAATPSQYGDSGLISVPTTEVTERGQFHIAAWLNYSQNDGERFTLLPISISMGIGDAWELSGSYPNVLLNDQNDGSMRGYENLGIKYRLIGEPDSDFKAAISAFLRQTVSEDEKINGLRDLGTRLIFSYMLTNAEIHLNVGYLKVDSPGGESYDNETLFGGAIDFPISERIRPFVEVDGNTSRGGGSSRIELTPGLQYYLLPYLSMIGGVGFGLTDTGPDYRAMVGVTFTSGAGRYVKAIPVIPGSRERYAAAMVAPEELMPELLIVPKEGVAEAAVAPAPGAPALESLEVKEAPPSPVGVPTAVLKPAGKEVIPLIGEVEALPVGEEKVEPKLEETEEGVVLYRATLYHAALFLFGEWEPTPYVKKVLDGVAKEIKNALEEAKGPIKVKVEGHTDNVGRAVYNKKLSYKRAEAIKAYIVKRHGIEPGIFDLKGYGEEMPVASDSTAEGRRKNRRVEIAIILEKPKE